MVRNIKCTIAMMICALYCLCIVMTKSANILAIIPIPSYSHQVPFQSLWTALSQRGHKVVVITSDPINNSSLTNLTEISTRSLYYITKKVKFFNPEENQTWLDGLQEQLWLRIKELMTKIYEQPEIRKLYAPDSEKKFDVVIAEVLFTPAIYALAHRFNAPLIGIISFGLPANLYYTHGGPVLPSHQSSWELEKDIFNLSFWQRVQNFIRLWYYIYFVLHQHIPEQQAIAEKYLGKDIPHISDIEKNISIIFYNQDHVISHIRPQIPNIIPFSGLHISRKSVPLSKDLEKFLMDAPNGFIYVSLGSNVNMSAFSMNMLNIYHDVFASLPCKVLWKLNTELPNNLWSDNIYVAKWFPQTSILAHPKIKLFIYQGGVQSSEEAVYYAVPVLGIPIFCDQFGQVNKLESLGVGKYLDNSDVSKESLNASIWEILTDKRYKERMLNTKALSTDKPYKHLDNMIWWIEFVIRHKGAPHLRNNIANYPWYQRYDVDIIAFLSIVMFVTVFCALVIIYKMVKIVLKYNIKMLAREKEKLN